MVAGGTFAHPRMVNMPATKTYLMSAGEKSPFSRGHMLCPDKTFIGPASTTSSTYEHAEFLKRLADSVADSVP